jgi:hypothetical protein
MFRQANLIYSVVSPLVASDDINRIPRDLEFWEPGVTAENEIVTKEPVGQVTYTWHKIDPDKKAKQVVFYGDCALLKWTNGEIPDAMAPAPVTPVADKEFDSKEWCDAAMYLVGVTHISK